jgi:hypothetical protein
VLEDRALSHNMPPDMQADRRLAHTVSGMWLLTGSTMDLGSTVPVAALGRRGVYRK